MHQLPNRTYAGAPGETITVRTQVAGGGSVTVVLDGIVVSNNPTFPFKTNPGEETHMRVALLGANGDSCIVRISMVDGGTDGDLLLVQSLDPAPIHTYRFIVAPATAVAALDETRRSRAMAAPLTARRRAAKPRSRRGK